MYANHEPSRAHSYSGPPRPQAQLYATPSASYESYAPVPSGSRAAAFPAASSYTHSVPASATFAPQIDLAAQPRSFAAYPPLNQQTQYPQSYPQSQPQPGPSGAQERIRPQENFSFNYGAAEYEEEEYEEEYDDDDEERSQDAGRGKGKGRLGGARAPGACDPCKQSKVKCVFPTPGQKCRRCAHGGHECRISGRKQKPRPPSHGELLARLRDKDRVIYSLLMPQVNGQKAPAQLLPAGLTLPDAGRQGSSQSDQSPRSGTASEERDDPATLPTLPVWDKRTPKREVERRVEAWIDEARGRMMRWAGKGEGEDPKGGALTLSHPEQWVIPSPDLNPVPRILTDGVVTHQEVDKLFALFFDKINMSFSLCDPGLHTPTRVLESSPFLYTTICAVASRHYPQRPELRPRLLHYAKQAAATALNGAKSIETCQAYLLLGVYHPPPRNFVEDRTFLYLGLAIRMATDLELHLPPRARTVHTEQDERARLNRERAWLNCFCTDRSISTQLGKPSAISHKAFPFDLRQWWHSSEYNSPLDIHMCAYANLLQVVSGFHDVVCSDAYSTDGGNKKLDLKLVQGCADDIIAVGEDWSRMLAENSAKRPHPLTNWRDNIWRFLVAYAKLVVFSTGLQEGMRQGLKRDNPFSDQCIDAASEILTRVTEKLSKLGYLRYCVDAYFLFMGFAAAFLLKILRPKFSFMMREGREQEIVQLVQRLIDLLGSDEVAIDDHHTPKLYSRFLADVLAKHELTKTNKDSQVQRVGPSHSGALTASTASSHAMDLTPDPHFASPLTQSTTSPGALVSTPPDAWTYYDTALGQQSFMSTGQALQPAQNNENVTLASMSAITDPRFWDNATMPGFAWATGSWPMAVDEPPDTNNQVYVDHPSGGLYPQFQV